LEFFQNHTFNISHPPRAEKTQLIFAPETLRIHSLLDTVIHGGCRKPIYIDMKPTDRIFQQTNDTSDVSFFDE
jgi:hypothetical protein